MHALGTRLDLLNQIKTGFSSLDSLSQMNKPNLILYGEVLIDNKKNTFILFTRPTYVSHAERFSFSLMYKQQTFFFFLLCET